MITEDQKARARHHLGYLQVQAASTFQLGIPAAVQTQFVIEGAWDKILPSAEVMFERTLCRLDDIESHMFGGMDLADVTQTGNIQVNPDRLKELGKMYRYAQQSLANMLGIVANPFDQRDWARAGGGINVGMSG
jgi:hypothetical protein